MHDRPRRGGRGGPAPPPAPGALIFDPWFLAASGVVLGIVVGDRAGREATIPSTFAVLAGGTVLVLARARGAVHAALRLALLLACVGVGAARVAAIPRAVDGWDPGALMRVEGTLVRAPSPWRAHEDERAASPGPRSRPRRLALTDASLDAGLGVHAVDGIVHLLVHDVPHRLRAGDRLRATGVARRVEGPRNPGQRDARADARRAGVVLVLEVDDPRALRVVVEAPPWSPSANLEAVRASFVAHLRATLTPRAAGLAAALLVDVRDGLDDADEDALLATGLIHLIAISGFHIVLLVGAARVALSLVLSPRWTDVHAIAFALAFAGLAGAGAPVVRSAVGFAIARTCALLARSTPPLAPVAIAAIVLALAAPEEVFRPGYQLSFSAVLGLVTMPHVRMPARVRSSRFAGAIGSVVLALRTSVRATLWTLPFLVFHFGTVAPWSPLLTVLLTPWFVVAFGLAALELPQFVLFGGLAPIHAACSWMLERFADLVVLAAALPGSVVQLPRDRVGPLVLALGALLCWMERRTRTALAVGGVALALSFVPPAGVDGLDVHLLDVGHGQALLVRAESGMTALVDAGALGRDDCGERILLPAFDALGVRTIDVLILTHGDADHVNGAARLLEAGVVRRVVHGPSFARTRTAAAVLETARALGVPVDLARAGTRIVDAPDVRIDALAPDGDTSSRSSNDASLVVRIDHAAGSMLVTGDLETAGIDALLASSHAASADVLVVPHHGQREPRLGLLLERVAPRLALASRRGPLPRGEAIPLARRVGAALWSTSEHGAIHVVLRLQRDAGHGVGRAALEASGWASKEFLALELPAPD